MMTRLTNLPYRLGRRPGEQGPRTHSRNQGWIDKFNTGTSKIKIARQNMKIGTWNVRTLREDGQYELLREEMKPYECDILGISEMRWKGKGELNNGEVIWSGGKNAMFGVGFVLSKRAREALIGYNQVNDRIIAARFNGQPMHFTVIQVYAPTSSSSDEEIDEFYRQLEETMASVNRKDVKIVIGDWNAKVGDDNSGTEMVMGRYGYGERNDRGERLIEFASRHKLYIANTRFQQKESRKWTWLSPGGMYHNMIDLVLIERRWLSSMRNCRTYQGADIGSDHSLVMCKVQLRLKDPKQRRKVRMRLDTEALNQPDIRTRFQIKVSEKIQANRRQDLKVLEERTTGLYNAIREAMTEGLPTVRKPNNPWITQKTLHLADVKRNAKNNRLQSAEKMNAYRKLCNVVRKAARDDKKRWLEQKCREIERSAQEKKTRQTYLLIKDINRKWEPKQRFVKDRDGQLLHTSEETKARWTEYCRELYMMTEDYDASVVTELENIAPSDDDRNDALLRCEVETAIQKLKPHKAPGTDGITAEILQAGGEELVDEMFSICNQAWIEEIVPEEWTKSVIVTLPKKGDLGICSNYRTLSLINHMCKVYLLIILERLKTAVEPYMAEEQAGFRSDRSTVQQILTLRLIEEKITRKKERQVMSCFIDFTKAFDSIRQDVIWAVLKSYGVDAKLIRVLRNIYDSAKAAVRVGNEVGEWFRQEKGSRQGDPLSPVIFIVYLERVMQRLCRNMTGVSIHGRRINNLRFADDVTLFEESWDQLQESLDIVASESGRYGLKINTDKTKGLMFGDANISGELSTNNRAIEAVDKFIYLGSMVNGDGCECEIRRRIGMTYGMLDGFDKIWKSHEISLRTKIHVLQTCVFSVLLYAAETWTLKKADWRRLTAFEMRCYRRLLGVRWFHRITNEEVLRRVNPRLRLEQIIKKRKLGLFGHICRMKDDRLVKIVMTGIVDGNNRRGRPKICWTDNVREWCQADLHTVVRMTEDREAWRREIERVIEDTNG